MAYLLYVHHNELYINEIATEPYVNKFLWGM